MCTCYKPTTILGGVEQVCYLAIGGVGPGEMIPQSRALVPAEDQCSFPSTHMGTDSHLWLQFQGI